MTEINLTDYDAVKLKDYNMTHMVAPSKFQYGWSKRKYCVEGRDKNTGHLDLNIPLPFCEATENTLIKYYWTKNPTMGKVTQEQICKWYNNQGIFFRPKTW